MQWFFEKLFDEALKYGESKNEQKKDQKKTDS